MRKLILSVFQTIIITILIYPAMCLAQCPDCGRKDIITINNLALIKSALSTELGQKIIDFIDSNKETISFDEANSLSTPRGILTIVPIKSSSDNWKAIQHLKMNDGNEFLSLVEFDFTQKSVSVSFASGQTYSFSALGFSQTTNTDFQFQQFDDLNNTVSFISTYSWCAVLYFLCIVCASFIIGCLFILLIPCLLYFGFCF